MTKAVILDADDLVAERQKLGISRRDELIGDTWILNPPASFEHGQAQLAIGEALRRHYDAVAVERGVWNGTTSPKGEDGFYVVDVAALRTPVDPQAHTVGPDEVLLAVEILSPSNGAARVNEKRRFCERTGIDLMVVDLDRQIVDGGPADVVDDVTGALGWT